MGEGVEAAEAIVAIDPGSLHTGVVHMTVWSVLDSRTFAFKAGCGADNDLLDARCEEIWTLLRRFLETHEHGPVVMEGFVPYPGRCGGTKGSHQTPWLCGQLLGHLREAGEEVVLQTSRQVLNGRTRGNAAWTVDWLRNRRQFYLGQGLVTNEHERSAFAHGWYYLHTGEGAPNEEG